MAASAFWKLVCEIQRIKGTGGMSAIRVRTVM